MTADVSARCRPDPSGSSARRPLPPAVIAGLVVVSFGLADAVAGTPFRAIVRDPETPFRCGPGEAFYRCGTLGVGDEVEVHRRSGDYLAIRPPAGSHDWIPARQVRPTTTAGVVQVIAPAAVAWVGSDAETVRTHRWQVRLDVGESLAVLGAKRLAASPQATPETWYKIAPPAGEFRYVAAAAVRAVLVEPSPEVLDRLRIGSEADPGPSPAMTHSAERAGGIASGDVPGAAATTAASPGSVGPDDVLAGPPPFEVAPPGAGVAGASAGEAGRSDPLAGTGSGSDGAGYDVFAGAIVGPPGLTPREAVPGISDRPYGETVPAGPPLPIEQVAGTLARLEVEMAAILARPRETWDFARPRATLRRLPLEQMTILERGLVRQLAERIAAAERVHDAAHGATGTGGTIVAGRTGPAAPRLADAGAAAPGNGSAGRPAAGAGVRGGEPGRDAARSAAGGRYALSASESGITFRREPTAG